MSAAAVGVRVIVSAHATQRYALRADKRLEPVSIAWRIEQALEAGRWSRRRPKWLRGEQADRVTGTLFAWPEDRGLVYALVEAEDADAWLCAMVLARSDAERRRQIPRGRSRRPRVSTKPIGGQNDE